MIVRDKQLIDGGITPVFLMGCIKEHEARANEMQTLYNAYNSKPPILSRTMTEGLPNNKLVHNYARYIVAISSGYLVGEPVTYQSDTEDIEALVGAYKYTRIPHVDSELAKNAALYGKGVELCYANNEARVQSVSLDPRNAFVVYENNVLYTPILGFYSYSIIGDDGKTAGVEIQVYDDTSVYTYRGKDREGALSKQPDIKPHYFGGLPMIEYWNNDDETGDFEHVMTLIDAYDLLQSDRINDKQQLVQAILVMTGARMESEPDKYDEKGEIVARGRTAAQQIREDKMIFLPDQDATAHYLTKNLVESDVEILRDSLKADIHKFSMVPDLSDENFSSNASGVAMRYKLFGLEQMTKTKERWFEEALRERLGLYANFLSLKGAKHIDTDNVQIIFKRALPVNESEIAQMIATLRDMVPEEILMAQLPFIEDAAGAKETLDVEREQAIQRQQRAFGMPVEDKFEG